MRVCGIIAEYDPLHSGHAHHLREARRLTQADVIVCVMSGSFTQRGMPAILCTHTRAEMALRAGADIVLGLPVSYSVCDAERFALGGVSILMRMGAEALCFGMEPAGIPVYQEAAHLLEQPSPAFLDRLHALLSEGLSFPRAQGQALAEALCVDEKLLSMPNTVLAICYARAIRRLKAPMALVPVPRSGDYHSDQLSVEALPSATAVRSALLSENFDAAERSMPPEAYALCQADFARGAYHAPDALNGLLRWVLRHDGDFSRLPDLSEGLENRLYSAANCLTREDMVLQIKSKRYPYARINRLLTHALLGTDARRLSALPPHAYVLGLRREVSPLLKAAMAEDFALFSSLAGQQLSYEMALDARADDLWALGARQPFGNIYRRPPVLL